MTFEKMCNGHIEDMAKILSINYQQELLQNSSLPNKDFFETFCCLIKEIVEKNYGIVAIQGNKIVGYISGMPVNAFKGLNRGIFTGLYAHSATGNKKDIYQRMYAHISEIWVQNGCLTHAIWIYAHDQTSVNTWFNLGFGNRCVDALRSLEGIAGIENNVYQIRLATENEAELLVPIFTQHNQYYSSAPLFMPITNVITINDIKKTLIMKDRYTWVAYRDKIPIAMMACRKGGENLFIADDEKTINICGAYVYEEFRGKGISANILNTIIEWAKDSGYQRLGVDYETFNILGSRFWEKYFIPFAYSMFRKLDEKILWANENRLKGIIV